MQKKNTKLCSYILSVMLTVAMVFAVTGCNGNTQAESAGDEGEYGLYVKTVNGITADYDKDGAYWAFYVNGEYASSGVDSTPIAEGESYCFRVEKE